MKKNNVFVKPIAFSVLVGSLYLIYNAIDSWVIRIILTVVLVFITLFITSAILINNEKCPFLNDIRLFESNNINPDIWYENDNFCSVADPLNSSNEVVDGIMRRISYTNEYYSCCMNNGENCPIFMKFNKLSNEELRRHYNSKWSA